MEDKTNAKKVCADAISVFGERFQILKAVEEHLELTIELVRYLVGKGDREHIVEELNDCLITTEQLIMIFKITRDELQKEKEKKIERLKANIDGFKQSVSNRKANKRAGIKKNKK